MTKETEAKYKFEYFPRVCFRYVDDIFAVFDIKAISVPSADLENNHNQKKYTINRIPGGKLEISRLLCVLLIIGTILLAILIGLLAYFLIPANCTEDKLIANNEIEDRLPRNVEPTHYRLQLVPDFYNSSISGAVTISLNALEETDTIVFHVNDIMINSNSLSVRPTTGDSTPIEIESQEYENDYKYKVVLKDNLKKDTPYQLETKFVSKFNDHLMGMYKVQYNDSFGNDKYIANTQFAPTDARRVFPCFDEPSFKSKFTISIARSYNMTSLSNMPQQSSDISTEKEATYWDHYPETPKMPTYSVAFIISNFKQRPIVKSSISIWTRDDTSVQAQTEYAANIAPRILRYFENYFNISFALPKLSLVALPELGYTAMENWGLITFREDQLLYDPNNSIKSDKRNIAAILAHEIAHQWFGNLVTPKWWNDVWLNEGFATYFQYKGANHRIFHTFSISSTVIGACLIRMMNHFLGEETFKGGIIKYLKNHENGNVEHKNLLDSLTQEAHDNGILPENETVNDIMASWIEKPGFPVVTVVANYEKNQLFLSQKRFYFTSKNEESFWWVPLSFTTNKEADFSNAKPKFWLKGEQKITEDVQLDKWYLLNINQTGYFIVNYDEKNWRALSENIMTFPPNVRAQLIGDSMDLAKANLLGYEIPLQMIAKMAIYDSDIAPVPTTVALNKLKFLDEMLSGTSAFGNFEVFHETIFKDTYQKVNFDPKLDDFIKRTILEWSCRSPISKCAQTFMGHFRNLYFRHQNVEPALRPRVYCAAVMDGERNWAFMYQRYLFSTSFAERECTCRCLGMHQRQMVTVFKTSKECGKLLKQALVFGRKSRMSERYLDKLIDDSGIPSQEANGVFASVARNPIGTPIAFDFLRNNWNDLLNRYGDGFNILAEMVRSLAYNMNTEFQLNELKRFRDNIRANASTASFALDTTIETVRGNVEWMRKNYDHVDKWLTSYKNHFSSP
ncbi:hypothetical protein NQ318_013680 [Aromia moschata]|uniref:Aminopeptidase n=1 Tax=Aromia moschata TaxID=1265417 RepID=A0AAV8Z995_9CUCU|nr:hypothetical protein NQ318_013680 [Aromia moschata]